jgi:hypothetical protein
VRRWPALVLSLALALALACPAAAAAADRFVKAGGADTGDCTDPTPGCLTLSYAVGQSSDGDVIHIGPGEFLWVDTPKMLTFAGAGAADPGGFDASRHTLLNPDGGAATLTNGGTLRDLMVKGADSADPVDRTPAIVLDASSNTTPVTFDLTNVTATGGRNPDMGDQADPALQMVGGGAPMQVNVSDSRFHVPEFGDAVVGSGADAAVALNRTTFFSGPGRTDDAVSASQGFDVTATDLRIAPGATFETGVIVIQGSDLMLDRSSLVMGTPEASQVVFAGGGPGDGSDIRIVDSLLALRDSFLGSALLTIASAGQSLNVQIQRSTIVGSSYDLAAGLTMNAFGGPVRVESVNSVLRAIDTDASNGDRSADVRADADTATTGTLDARASSYTTVEATGEGTNDIPAPGSGTNVAGDPLFASVGAEDFSLMPASPLIDRGDPGAVAPGQLDLAGNPRSLDGNRDCVAAPDIGAFELDGFAAACPVAVGAGLTADLKGALIRLFRRTIRLDRRGRAPVPVECDRSEPDPCAGLLALSTRVPGTIAQRRRRRARTVRLGQARFRILPGRRATVRVRLSRRNRARLRRMKKMRVRARVTARDPAGNASSASTTFTLKPRATRKRRRR